MALGEEGKADFTQGGMAVGGGTLRSGPEVRWAGWTQLSTQRGIRSRSAGWGQGVENC